MLYMILFQLIFIEIFLTAFEGEIYPEQYLLI